MKERTGEGKKVRRKKGDIRCNRPTSPLVNSSHLPLALAIAVVCSKHCDSYSASFDFRSFNLEIDSAVSAFWSSSAFLLVSFVPLGPLLFSSLPGLSP
jgi:hypothetical protein